MRGKLRGLSLFVFVGFLVVSFQNCSGLNSQTGLAVLNELGPMDYSNIPSYLMPAKTDLRNIITPASDVKANSARILWSPVEEADFYSVQVSSDSRKIDPESCYNPRGEKSGINIRTSEYILKGLTPGLTYYYMVCAETPTGLFTSDVGFIKTKMDLNHNFKKVMGSFTTIYALSEENTLSAWGGPALWVDSKEYRDEFQNNIHDFHVDPQFGNVLIISQQAKLYLATPSGLEEVDLGNISGESFIKTDWTMDYLGDMFLLERAGKTYGIIDAQLVELPFQIGQVVRNYKHGEHLLYVDTNKSPMLFSRDEKSAENLGVSSGSTSPFRVVKVNSSRSPNGQVVLLLEDGKQYIYRAFLGLIDISHLSLDFDSIQVYGSMLAGFNENQDLVVTQIDFRQDEVYATNVSLDLQTGILDFLFDSGSLFVRTSDESVTRYNFGLMNGSSIPLKNPKGFQIPPNVPLSRFSLQSSRASQYFYYLSSSALYRIQGDHFEVLYLNSSTPLNAIGFDYGVLVEDQAGKVKVFPNSDIAEDESYLYQGKDKANPKEFDSVKEISTYGTFSVVKLESGGGQYIGPQDWFEHGSGFSFANPDYFSLRNKTEIIVKPKNSSQLLASGQFKNLNTENIGQAKKVVCNLKSCVFLNKNGELRKADELITTNVEDVVAPQNDLDIFMVLFKNGNVETIGLSQVINLDLKAKEIYASKYLFAVLTEAGDVYTYAYRSTGVLKFVKQNTEKVKNLLVNDYIAGFLTEGDSFYYFSDTDKINLFPKKVSNAYRIHDDFGFLIKTSNGVLYRVLQSYRDYQAFTQQYYSGEEEYKLLTNERGINAIVVGDNLSRVNSLEYETIESTEIEIPDTKEVTKFVGMNAQKYLILFSDKSVQVPENLNSEFENSDIVDIAFFDGTYFNNLIVLYEDGRLRNIGSSPFLGNWAYGHLTSGVLSMNTFNQSVLEVNLINGDRIFLGVASML